MTNAVADPSVLLQATVSELKTKIASTQATAPVDRQRLIFKGRVLLDAKPLSDYRMLLPSPCFSVSGAHFNAFF